MNKIQYLFKHRANLIIFLYTIYISCLVVNLFGENEIKFKDAQLKHSIERTLGKTDPNRLDLFGLEELDVSHESIQSLEGLEYATNLRTLDISYNDITRLEPICELEELYDLNISGLKLKDTSSLKVSKNLTYLSAKDCGLSDISFIKDLKELFYLNLSCNQISDLTPLRSVRNLSTLYLENNLISDISSLNYLRSLDELILSNNKIQDVSPLSELSELEYLVLANNRITDISCLTNLSQLNMVSLNHNPLSQQSVTNYLPKIWQNNKDQKWCDIYFNEIKYDPNKSFLERDFAFSQAAALNPDENSILLVAAPKGNAVTGLESGGRIFLLSLSETEPKKLMLIPDVRADAMGGALGTIDWRNESQFHVLTSNDNGGNKQLFIHSIQNEAGQLEINTKCLQTDIHFLIELAWSPYGRFLSGRTFGLQKKLAVLDYETGSVRKYEVPSSIHYCWVDDKTLFSCPENQIVRSTIKGLAKADNVVVRKAINEANLGGIINRQLVYSVDCSIYLGDKIIFTGDFDIEKLFVGKSQVAYVCENIVGVIDLDGQRLFTETLADDTQLLAYSQKQGALYLLTHDRTCIESRDIKNNGKKSTLCNIAEIKNAIREN